MAKTDVGEYALVDGVVQNLSIERFAGGKSYANIASFNLDGDDQVYKYDNMPESSVMDYNSSGGYNNILCEGDEIKTIYKKVKKWDQEMDGSISLIGIYNFRNSEILFLDRKIGNAIYAIPVMIIPFAIMSIISKNHNAAMAYLAVALIIGVLIAFIIVIPALIIAKTRRVADEIFQRAIEASKHERSAST